MKKFIGVILTLVVNSFAEKVPETTALDPELYTIQLMYVGFPSGEGTMMGEEEKRIMEEYVNSSEEWKNEEEREEAYLKYLRDLRRAEIRRIESMEGEYTKLTTIYTSSGKRIPEVYSNNVKGMLDVESNTLVLGFYFPSVGESNFCSEQTVCRFCVNEWFICGGGARGDIKSWVILAKCYPPTNAGKGSELLSKRK